MIKKLLFLAIVTIVVTHTHTAYAFDFLQYGPTVETINCTGDTISYFSQIDFDGSPVGDNCPGTIPIPYFSIGSNVIAIECDSALSTLPNPCDSVDLDINVALNNARNDPGFISEKTFIWGEVPSDNIWGTTNGFWGDTTPTEIMGDMTASVQNTGAQIWPLFAFVGVVLAFGIAGLVVMFIKNSIKPTIGRKEIINPGGTDIIYHSAEDLEFKREYGQPKRGRGRPRKYPL